MSQHDFLIDNQTFPAHRADLNSALQALATLSSGPSAPTTTYANMLWYDTANNILKMRTEADDAWIDIGTLNQSTNEFEAANLTELAQTQVEDDTDTTFGLVSGERLGQAVAANAGGGLTLLGTLTTTSGTTQTLSGLDLTPYKCLRIVVDGVSHNSTSQNRLALNGVGFSVLDTNARTFKGLAEVNLEQQMMVGIVNTSTPVGGQISSSGPSTSDTSLSFDWNFGASFNGGTISVYGEA